MDDEKYWNLMIRYLADDLSLREAGELSQWLEQPERVDILQELQEVWNRSKNYPENFSVDTHAAWLKVSQTAMIKQNAGIGSKEQKRAKRLKIIAFFLVILGVLVLTYMYLI